MLVGLGAWEGDTEQKDEKSPPPHLLSIYDHLYQVYV